MLGPGPSHHTLQQQFQRPRHISVCVCPGSATALEVLVHHLGDGPLFSSDLRKQPTNSQYEERLSSPKHYNTTSASTSSTTIGQCQQSQSWFSMVCSTSRFVRANPLPATAHLFCICQRRAVAFPLQATGHSRRLWIQWIHGQDLWLNGDCQMGVSINGDSPKSPLLVGVCLILPYYKPTILGIPPFMETPICVTPQLECAASMLSCMTSDCSNTTMPEIFRWQAKSWMWLFPFR